MAKSNNSFEDKLKDRYKNYESQPPDSVWHDIDKRLNRKNRRRFLWILLPVMIIFAGTGYFFTDLSYVDDNARQSNERLEEIPLKAPNVTTEQHSDIASSAQKISSSPNISAIFPAGNRKKSQEDNNSRKSSYFYEQSTPISYAKTGELSLELEYDHLKNKTANRRIGEEETEPCFDQHNHVLDFFITSGVNYGMHILTGEGSMNPGKINSPYIGAGFKYGQSVNPYYSWHTGLSVEWQQHNKSLRFVQDRAEFDTSPPVSGEFSPASSRTNISSYQQLSTLNFSFFGEIQRRLPRNFYLKAGTGVYHSRTIRTVDINEEVNLKFDTFDKIHGWGEIGAGYTLNRHNKELYFEAGGQYFYPKLWNTGIYEVPFRLNIKSGIRYKF